MELLSLENSRYLITMQLNADDKINRGLDFIGGFELIDKEMRMYFFEGLSGEGSSM